MMSKSRKEESCKSNPYIRKSIGKSLLTPCRQVGLSRKRKSSNNLNQSLPHIEFRNNPTPTISTELEANNQNDENKMRSNHDLSEESREKVIRYLEMNENGNNEINKNLENNENHTKDHNSNVSDGQNKASIQTKKKNKKSRKKSKRSSKTDESLIDQDKKSKNSKTVDRSRTTTPTLFDDDEDFVEDNKVKMQRTKHIKEKSKSYDQQLLDKTNSNKDCNNRELKITLKRIDSDPIPRVYTNKKLEKTETVTKAVMKIVHIDDEESFHIKKRKKPSDSSNLNEAKVLSPKNCQISESKIQDSPEIPILKPISPAKKQKKISRSLSLKKTHSDEQNSFDLDDEFLDENCPPPPLQIDPGKIDELEREITSKRENLENLQQTEIYKRLHDVNELKKITEIWKTGCIAALNDLLPQLKPYADIDMETLLEKLKVPEHLIKLSPVGELI